MMFRPVCATTYDLDESGCVCVCVCVSVPRDAGKRVARVWYCVSPRESLSTEVLV